jgi:hypothetical protein
MNGSFVNRQARHLARRASRESGGDRDAAVRRCYLLALGRPPGPAEHKAALQTAAQHGLETVAWALFNASEFGYLR